jgi:predicted ATPase
LWTDPSPISGVSLSTTPSAQAAAEICRRQLAAVRVEFFGLSGLSRNLNDMFTVLTRGRRFALPRHQTLRAALD